MLRFFQKLCRGRHLRQKRQWISSLGKSQLLALLFQPDSGLDREDWDALVQLAFNTYSEGHRDRIIQRIAEHLTVENFEERDKK